jgi:hypothetical protein
MSSRFRRRIRRHGRRLRQQPHERIKEQADKLSGEEREHEHENRQQARFGAIQAEAARQRELGEDQYIEGLPGEVKEAQLAAAKRAGTYADTSEFQKGLEEESDLQAAGARSEALRRRAAGLRNVGDLSQEALSREASDIDTVLSRLSEQTPVAVLGGQDVSDVQRLQRSSAEAKARGARSAALRRQQARQRALNVPVTETV